MTRDLAVCLRETVSNSNGLCRIAAVIFASRIVMSLVRDVGRYFRRRRGMRAWPRADARAPHFRGYAFLLQLLRRIT